MSRLEELINELCPNGVVYKKLSDVTTVDRGTRVVRGQLSQKDGYPVYQNSLTIMGYYTKSNYPANTTFIIGAGAAGEIGYSHVDFWAADDCFPIVGNPRIIDRYIYHVLLWKKPILLSRVRKASVPRLSRTVIEDLIIPLPPLEVQREIVRILDKFTKLTAELTAELTARQKQYEYYRTQLLHFESDTPTKTIGELCNVITGGEPPVDCIKGNLGDSTHPYPVWGNGKEVYGYSGTYKIDRDSVVISSIGANTGTVYYREAYFTPIIRLKVIMPKDPQLNARFLFHALSATEIKSKSSSVPNMNANEIKSIRIPIPPIAIQNRIAMILDNFDAICNDLTSGLPAEIAARQKQYEYYRDRLLTFESRRL